MNKTVNQRDLASGMDRGAAASSVAQSWSASEKERAVSLVASPSTMPS